MEGSVFNFSEPIFFRWHRRFFRFFFSRFSKSISGVVGTSGVDSCFWSFFASSTLTMILGNRIGSLPVISCLSDFFCNYTKIIKKSSRMAVRANGADKLSMRKSINFRSYHKIENVKKVHQQKQQ